MFVELVIAKVGLCFEILAADGSRIGVAPDMTAVGAWCRARGGHLGGFTTHNGARARRAIVRPSIAVVQNGRVVHLFASA